MKTELEQRDIEAIAEKVVEKLKVHLSNINKCKESDIIFTKKTLAEYLHVSVKWVDGYKELGMPYCMLKGHVRFRKSQIDKWLESKEIPAVSRIDRIMKAVK